MKVACVVGSFNLMEWCDGSVLWSSQELISFKVGMGKTGIQINQKMNSFINTNDIFTCEQDINSVHSNLFGSWSITNALSDVYSTLGKKIGEINSVIANTETSEIEYVVFQFDQNYGLGEKNYFLPWDTFNTENQKKLIFMPIAFKTLIDAPSFYQNQWPEDVAQHLKSVKDYWEANLSF